MVTKMEMVGRHGDGFTYSGICLCHGVECSGLITLSRPHPYLASADPFGGGPRVLVVMITTNHGVHEVPFDRQQAQPSRPLSSRDADTPPNADLGPDS